MRFYSISSLHRISSAHYFQSRPCQNLSMCLWRHGLCLLKKEKLQGKKSQRIALHWQLWERSWNGNLDACQPCRGCETCGRKPESEFGREDSEDVRVRLIALEKFARENGDDAVLFGPNKRPFLAATIQTFIRKFLYFLIYWFNQIPASRLRCFRLEPKFFFVIYRCRSFVSSFNGKIKNTHCFCFGLPRFYFKVIRKSL